MKLDMANDAGMQRIRAGRTVEEQIECINRDGNLVPFPMLRERLIAALGIKPKRTTAPNVIIFGCFFPFMQHGPIRSYLALLDHLGVEYTFLDKEICCGAPMMETSQGEEKIIAEDASRQFMMQNLSLAQAVGARNMVYWCVWCAYLGKRFLGETNVEQLYFPDLALRALGKERLSLTPQTIGYYDGCHQRAHALAPGFDLNWRAYRDILSKIEGLQVVDLPRNACCIHHSPEIIETAAKLQLQEIACSCTAGLFRLGKAATAQVQVSYWSDVMLRAVGGHSTSRS